MTGDYFPFLGIYMNKYTRRVDSIFITSFIIIWAILWRDVAVGMVTRGAVFKSVLNVNYETNKRRGFQAMFFISKLCHRQSLIVIV